MEPDHNSLVFLLNKEDKAVSKLQEQTSKSGSFDAGLIPIGHLLSIYLAYNLAQIFRVMNRLRMCHKMLLAVSFYDS